MKKIILLMLILVGVTAVFACCGKCGSAHHKHSFYDLKANSIDGEEISMETYKGKVVLVVNTASKCGFTSQYKGLQELYTKYQDKGLVILAFPCNQFMSQEPGTDAEIKEFCTKQFNVTFPIFSKIDVNGEYSHPLYIFLKSQFDDKRNNDIGWNFTKFLINKEGEVVDRFSPMTGPSKIEDDIVKLLN
jgi:glutathione peroxidase